MVFKSGFDENRSKNGGRLPMPPEFRELLHSASLPALKTVIEIANDPEAKKADRIKATEIILDRAYGKATQPISGENVGEPARLEVTVVTREADRQNNDNKPASTKGS